MGQLADSSTGNFPGKRLELISPDYDDYFQKYHIPFGMTPGSINVARPKLVSTRKVMTPWSAGTHGY